jgi:hypothetical protein
MAYNGLKRPLLYQPSFFYKEMPPSALQFTGSYGLLPSRPEGGYLMQLENLSGILIRAFWLGILLLPWLAIQ